MKTDDELMAEGVHPKDVEWLEARLAQLTLAMLRWADSRWRTDLRSRGFSAGDVIASEIDKLLGRSDKCPTCGKECGKQP